MGCLSSWVRKTLLFARKKLNARENVKTGASAVMEQVEKKPMVV